MTEQGRLNVRVDKQLLKDVRIKGLQENTTLSHLVRDFLTHYMGEPLLFVPTHLLREREACIRIAQAGGIPALHTIRGPVAHKLGFHVWHFTSNKQSGRVRCQFRDHLTGQPMPDQWELIWIEEPLERQSSPDSP